MNERKNVMSERQEQISELAGNIVRHQRHFGAMTTEDRQWVIQNTTVAIELFANAVKNRDSGGINIPDVFHLTVDYSQSLEEMIAAGRYDWKNSDITAKRFPVEGTGVVEFEARYFHFDHNISSENAVKEIEQADKDNPWMSAKIEHVLAHGASFPEEQRKYPIVGLGSVGRFDGYRRVPFLYEGGSGRDLGLRWWDGGWPPICRFLAVRKVSAP